MNDDHATLIGVERRPRHTHSESEKRAHEQLQPPRTPIRSGIKSPPPAWLVTVIIVQSILIIILFGWTLTSHTPLLSTVQTRWTNPSNGDEVVLRKGVLAPHGNECFCECSCPVCPSSHRTDTNRREKRDSTPVDSDVVKAGGGGEGGGGGGEREEEEEESGPLSLSSSNGPTFSTKYHEEYSLVKPNGDTFTVGDFIRITCLISPSLSPIIDITTDDGLSEDIMHVRVRWDKERVVFNSHSFSNGNKGWGREVHIRPIPDVFQRGYELAVTFTIKCRKEGFIQFLYNGISMTEFKLRHDMKASPPTRLHLRCKELVLFSLSLSLCLSVWLYICFRFFLSFFSPFLSPFLASIFFFPSSFHFPSPSSSPSLVSHSSIHIDLNLSLPLMYLTSRSSSFHLSNRHI